MARAGLGMLLPKSNVSSLVNADYDDEVSVNSGFAKQTAPERQRWERGYTQTVRERLAILRDGLVKSFLALLFATVLGVGLLKFWTPSTGAKAWLGVLSVFCFALATLARLGKPATSIGGRTAVERLDLRILWILYWLGMFIGTLALL